ncbi:MAG TPA: DNA gyrase inhibitor YacG [Methylomirabilota bacterium]
MTRSENRAVRLVRCPRCGTGREWSGNPHRPFCSLTCRLVDLGVWLDERHRIPGPELSTDSESAASGSPTAG